MFRNQQETGAKSNVKCWLLIGALPVGVVLATYGQQGFVAAGRAATDLVMPVAIVWLILWAKAVFSCSQRRWRPTLVWSALFFVWTAVGNGMVVSQAVRWIEKPPADLANSAIQFDAVVTLGGSAGLVTDELAEINADGERVVSAAQAYHAGTTRTIITTGSSTDGIGDPSEIGRELLISLGVPAERIFALAGVNTMAEMQSLAKFLQSPPDDWRSQVDDPEKPTVGLITSAFHMSRAIRLAQQQNLDLVPQPCAYKGQYLRRPAKASDWIPTSSNQATLGLVIKESIAWMVGR